MYEFLLVCVGVCVCGGGGGGGVTVGVCNLDNMCVMHMNLHICEWSVFFTIDSCF